MSTTAHELTHECATSFGTVGQLFGLLERNNESAGQQLRAKLGICMLACWHFRFRLLLHYDQMF